MIPKELLVLQHKELTKEDLMYWESFKEDNSQEDGTEEPEFHRKYPGHFLYWRGILVWGTGYQNDTQQLQQPFRMPSKATQLSMRKKSYYSRITALAF